MVCKSYLFAEGYTVTHNFVLPSASWHGFTDAHI